MNASDLVNYLDGYLAIEEFTDYRGAYNGLQVEGRSGVSRVVTAVDACQFTIDLAVEQQADFMIVHHGLFWSAPAPVTGRAYRRLAALIKAGVGLYSCHLPLDAHPEVGNNCVLARTLGLAPTGVFGRHEGTPIGVISEAQVGLQALVERIRAALRIEPRVIATGPVEAARIGILTGAGGSVIGEAFEAGIDTLITGEGPHHTYFDAEELGVNVIYAGHYATETVGVQALGKHLGERFGLTVEFIDHPTGL